MKRTLKEEWKETEVGEEGRGQETVLDALRSVGRSLGKRSIGQNGADDLDGYLTFLWNRKRREERENCRTSLPNAWEVKEIKVEEKLWYGIAQVGGKGNYKETYVYWRKKEGDCSDAVGACKEEAKHPNLEVASFLQKKIKQHSLPTRLVTRAKESNNEASLKEKKKKKNLEAKRNWMIDWKGGRRKSETQANHGGVN